MQFQISVFLLFPLLWYGELFNEEQVKLGYDRDHVIVLPIDDKMVNNLAVIKQQFRENMDVLSVSACSNTPAGRRRVQYAICSLCPMINRWQYSQIV